MNAVTGRTRSCRARHDVLRNLEVLGSLPDSGMRRGEEDVPAERCFWCLCLPLGGRYQAPPPPSPSAVMHVFYHEDRGKCCKKLLRFNDYPNKMTFRANVMLQVEFEQPNIFTSCDVAVTSTDWLFALPEFTWRENGTPFKDNQPQYTRLGSNPNLHVIGGLVYYQNDALYLSDTERSQEEEFILQSISTVENP
uniref:Uncharacterized protein n=1 Tax=Timema shepardi TaxID=629360 RepID=A0A7R9ARS5_TIMSH|nr:unnamed protein product [Timema shepardi]